MVTLKLTNQQAEAVRAVLNFSGVNKGALTERSVENEGAAHVGMKFEDMERCIQEVWEALREEAIEREAA